MGFLTVQDAYEHLIDVYDGDGKSSPPVVRKLRRAVSESLREFGIIHDWNWLKRAIVFSTSPSYSTGTITYDSATRTVTLASGTWPSDADRGFLIVNFVPYRVLSRTSSTVIILDPAEAPSDDLAAGTEYEWVRVEYDLPVGVRDVSYIEDAETGTIPVRFGIDEGFRLLARSSGSVCYSGYSIVPGARGSGRKSVRFTEVNAASRTIRAMYEASVGEASEWELSSGTVSVSGRTATFSSSVLSDKHVGSVLRVAANGVALAPTSIYGRYDATTEEAITRPPDQEFVISEVTSATTALLGESGTTASGSGYTISSRIDVPHDPLWDFFLKMCEHKYDAINRVDSKIFRASKAGLEESKMIAMCADAQHLRKEYVPDRTRIRLVNE